MFRQPKDPLTPEDALPDLRLVHVGGDVVDPRDVALYQERLSDRCLFVTGLGATETGMDLLYLIDKATPLDGPRVPLGSPVDGGRALVLDDDGIEARTGDEGEIAIESGLVAPGVLAPAGSDRRGVSRDGRWGPGADVPSHRGRPC